MAGYTITVTVRLEYLSLLRGGSGGTGLSHLH